jgi:filamentous hemagglutinin
MSTVKRVSGDYTVQTINAGDLVTLQSTNVNIVGDLTVTGNAVLTGNINADKIFNGTTSIDIPVINGNANITIGGTSNVAVWATTGEYVTGLISATGNVQGGNLRTAGQVSATGNISGGNLTVATGNIVLTQTSGATTSQMIRFQDANTTVTTLGANIGAIEWYTSDATTPGARVTARIQAVYEDVAGNANIQIQTGSTATPTTRITVIGSSGNVGIANAAPLHNLAVTGTVYGSSTLTAVGNITGGNVSTAGLVTATGNVTGGNLITGGLATVTGNITGGNVISLGAVSAGAAGISATGNITGGNLLSNGLISATANITGANVVGTQNIYTTGNVLANVVSATANIVGANLNITGNSYGTGIGVENIVWQSTDATVVSATPVPVGVLTFNALANQSYKFDAYIFTIPDGTMTTGFGVNFAAGTCQYIVQSQLTSSTSAWGGYSANTSNAMSATQGWTGATPHGVRITGTFYHTANTTVTINAQTNSGTLTIKTGSNLSYTRIG